MRHLWIIIFLYFFNLIDLSAQELFKCKNNKTGEIVWRNKKCESNEMLASQESLKDIISHPNKSINNKKDAEIQNDHEYESMIVKYNELKKSKDMLIIEIQETKAEFNHKDLDNVIRTQKSVAASSWVDPRVTIYVNKMNDKLQKLEKIKREMSSVYSKIAKKGYEDGKLKIRQTLPFERGNLGNCGGEC
ncbi:MAG: hypothetical protein HQL65_17175 [Magnetococcales bacterium]|nr:hypothetical protein [Magnetococcales bacterium]